MGHGGQTITICGDFGLICGVYVVPDTALSWARQAMSEVIDRHQAAGVEVPKSLYMDCGCCSGRATSHQSTSSDTTTSVTTLSVRLDAVHLMLRIGREMTEKGSSSHAGARGSSTPGKNFFLVPSGSVINNTSCLWH